MPVRSEEPSQLRLCERLLTMCSQKVEEIPGCDCTAGHFCLVCNSSDSVIYLRAETSGNVREKGKIKRVSLVLVSPVAWNIFINHASAVVADDRVFRVCFCIHNAGVVVTFAERYSKYVGIVGLRTNPLRFITESLYTKDPFCGFFELTCEGSLTKGKLEILLLEDVERRAYA